MASVTLAESAKLCQDKLIAGVIENVVSVDPMFNFIPFVGIDGNAVAYNRENALGDVVVGGVGDTFTSLSGGKAAATFTEVTSSLTTIMGDAEVNGLIAATRSSVQNQTAVQVASKAKSAGRKWRDMFVNGTGLNNQFTGLLGLCANAQKVDTGTNGCALSFAVLDELLDMITDKDGQADFITMPKRTIRAYIALLRAAGGAGLDEVMNVGRYKIYSYRGVPIFPNDYIPTNQTRGGTTGTCTTILAGTFDDGSMTHGVCGLTAANQSGIQVVEVGEKEDADEHITRVKWYTGLACFSEKGLAAAPGIQN